MAQDRQRFVAVLGRADEYDQAVHWARQRYQAEGDPRAAVAPARLHHRHGHQDLAAVVRLPERTGRTSDAKTFLDNYLGALRGGARGPATRARPAQRRTTGLLTRTRIE